jgi:hypothetical protein
MEKQILFSQKSLPLNRVAYMHDIGYHGREIRGICKVGQRQWMGSFLDGTCVINWKKNK